jgi:hypothetical protein
MTDTGAVHRIPTPFGWARDTMENVFMKVIGKATAAALPTITLGTTTSTTGITATTMIATTSMTAIDI